jgi:hypothetical protein
MSDWRPSSGGFDSLTERRSWAVALRTVCSSCECLPGSWISRDCALRAVEKPIGDEADSHGSLWGRVDARGLKVTIMLIRFRLAGFGRRIVADGA